MLKCWYVYTTSQYRICVVKVYFRSGQITYSRRRAQGLQDPEFSRVVDSLACWTIRLVIIFHMAPRRRNRVGGPELLMRLTGSKSFSVYGVEVEYGVEGV